MRRAGPALVILDAQARPGGAWRHDSRSTQHLPGATCTDRERVANPTSYR
ncbi:hypothetical protein [Plantactinospora soyae]|nr:hypothetical protein [Plantactinospora soyae]